ncbi:MAG: trk system potassium uptake protein TrkA, partial [Myxococcota bacterium]
MRAIIAGAGETGRLVAAQLSADLHDVVLVDTSAASLEAAEEILDIQTYQGDCTHRGVQSSLDVGEAGAFIAFTNDSSANVLSAAFASQAGCRMTIARVDNPSFLGRDAGVERDVLGIDYLLCPTHLMVTELVRQLAGSHCSLVIPVGESRTQLAAVPLGSNSPLLGRPASSVTLDHAVVTAVVRDRDVRPLPDISSLDIDDELLVFADADHLSTATKKITGASNQRVLIVGGGRTGTRLAGLLAKGGDRVTLVETAQARCESISADLPDVTVLNGDGTSVAFLQDLHIDTVDAIVAATSEDEVNLMVSLLARQMGVEDSFIEVHRPGYAELYRQLGVQGVVGSYDVLTNAATSAMKRETVANHGPIPNTPLELFEAEVPSGGWGAANGLPLPKSVRVLAVLRDGVVQEQR